MTAEQETPRGLTDLVRDQVHVDPEEIMNEPPIVDAGAFAGPFAVLAAQNAANSQALVTIARAIELLADHLGCPLTGTADDPLENGE